ncbi:MAG: nodulation protein NfeD [Chloroflexales bacterium]|nr:nodulation protein NfeD [Chloroflexales bacterium]
MLHISRQWTIGRLACLGWLMLLALSALGATPAAARAPGPVYSIELDGVFSRYSVGYLRRALREAEAAGAEALIVRLGTSGAVLRDLHEVAAEVAEAGVPVVVYVTPEGTRSGAAGAWLLPAAHLAAMAPETSFGLSTPLVDPNPTLSEPTRELLRAEALDQISAWSRSHNRSDAWVEQAVRQGVVLNNEQASALDPPAIDMVARDPDELLTLLEGRTVALADGATLTLSTIGRAAQPLPPTLLEQLLLLLANPTVAFLLLVMAGVAIYAELVSPTVGALAGIGAVLLIAAVAGLIALPVRWLAVLGILVAFGLIGADLFVPSHGAITVVGLVLLVLSAMTMFDAAQAPGVAVALWAVLLVAAFVAAFAALGIYMAVRTRNKPVATGQEGLVGRLAEVRRRLEPDGMVFVEGALWRAVSEDGTVEQGEWVRVTGVYELRLTVRRLTDDDLAGDEVRRGATPLQH